VGGALSQWGSARGLHNCAGHPVTTGVSCGAAEGTPQHARATPKGAAEGEAACEHSDMEGEAGGARDRSAGAACMKGDDPRSRAQPSSHGGVAGGVGQRARMACGGRTTSASWYDMLHVVDGGGGGVGTRESVTPQSPSTLEGLQKPSSDAREGGGSLMIMGG